jgi:hypothetical protein
MHVRRTSSIFAAILGIGFGLCMPTSVALAGDKNDKNDLEQLTAQWWQWAFPFQRRKTHFSTQTGGIA